MPGIARAARGWSSSPAMRCRCSMKASWPSICGRATNAGLFDVSHMGQLLLTGEGADAGAGSAVARRHHRPPLNRARYSLLLDDEGGILDDLMVTRDARGQRLSGRQRRDQIGRHRPSARESADDVITLNHLEDQRAARAAGAQGGGGAGPADPRRRRRWCSCRPARSPGRAMTLWISRSGYTGEDGFEISVPADARRGARRRALCASRRSSRSASARAIRCGWRRGCRSTATIWTRIPRRSKADLGFRDQQAPPRRGRFCRRRAHPGRARRMARDRKRVGLMVEGRQPVREGAEVFDGDGRLVGKVTSGGFAPSVGAPIAMAYVPAALAAPGTALEARRARQAHPRDGHRDAVRSPHRYCPQTRRLET